VRLTGAVKDRSWLTFGAVMVGMFLAAGVVFLVAERVLYRFGFVAGIVVVGGILLTWAWFHDRKAVDQARRDYAEP
jgi:hypothetical protein